MMLQAGLFDDNAHTRETIYSFMRLRALRVEVDVKLALGEFTLTKPRLSGAHRTHGQGDGAERSGAVFEHAGPSHLLSNRKIQITELLADARRAQGAEFSLLKFMTSCGTTACAAGAAALEMLGDASDVPRAARRPRAVSGWS